MDASTSTSTSTSTSILLLFPDQLAPISLISPFDVIFQVTLVQQLEEESGILDKIPPS